MKKIIMLALALGLSGASAVNWEIHTNQFLSKARALVVDCKSDAIFKAIEPSLSKGGRVYCAKTTGESAADDARDFLDIWFDEDQNSPWQDRKSFIGSLYMFDDNPDGYGVVLFKDSPRMVVFQVGK